MSDHMAAEIWIGGKIPASEVAGLCAAIGSEHVALDWGEGNFAPTSAQELLNAYDGEHLHLCDDQAAWGEFEALETHLREHNVPFDRRSEGKYEYDPEQVTFRPNSGSEVYTTTAAGNPTVAVASLQPVLEVLDSFHQWLQAGKISKAGALRRVQRLQKLLRATLPQEATPLEPFEIVED
jgi:hypothetical protein